MVSQQQLDKFNESGFITIPKIIDDDELVLLRQTCAELLESQTGKDDGNLFDLAGTGTDVATARLPQIMHPSEYAPALASLRYRTRAEGAARELLGDDVRQLNEHMIIKPARDGGETPWHQDQAYHSPALRYQNVNIWLALADATLDNGCLQYVPGSHRLDVLPHHPIGNDPGAAGLEVDNPEQYAAQAIACPVSAGDVVIHRSYILHYAGPNHTNEPRPAYVLVYGTEPTPRETPLIFPWLNERHEGSE